MRSSAFTAVVLAAVANAQGLEQFFSQSYSDIAPMINQAVNQFKGLVPDLYESFTSAAGGTTLPSTFNPEEYSKVISAFGGEEQAIALLSQIGITADVAASTPTGNTEDASQSASGSSPAESESNNNNSSSHSHSGSDSESDESTSASSLASSKASSASSKASSRISSILSSDDEDSE
ncbi:hypothetical protein EV182_007622, partial [Spiromyces aspiralis]